MRRILLVLGLLALTVPADAARVLCSRRSGAVAVREVCRANESRLDAQAFGLVGPPGPPGPSNGITCSTRCVSGDPSATFVCGGSVTTCPSPDGQQAVHGSFVDCTSTGILAIPFCLATACKPGLCSDELFDNSDAAKDARRVAAAQDTYFLEQGTYLSDCSALPGFTSSPGAICSTTFKACAGGYLGYTVVTNDSRLTTCIWDSCPPDDVRLRCSPFAG